MLLRGMDLLKREYTESGYGYHLMTKPKEEFPDRQIFVVDGRLLQDQPFPKESQDEISHGGELSDAVLSYIDQILMEEDTEYGAHVLQDSSVFQATERSFYEVLGKKYPPPHQEHPSTHLCLGHHNSTSGSRNQTGDASLHQSRFNTVKNEIDSSSGLYSVVKHRRFCGDGQVVWDFKEGIARAANSVPREGKLVHIIDVTIRNPRECEDKVVKSGDDEKDRAMATKIPQSFTESDIPIEEFDQLLLSTLDDRQAKDVQNAGSGLYKARLSKKCKKEEVDWATLLNNCAQMVALGDREAAANFLSKIRQHSSPNGDGTQRLAHYFADGLEARMAGTGGQMYRALASERITGPTCLKAYYMSIASFPFRKITNLVSNKLLAARSGSSARVHIIDFGILHGFQWPTFIRRLARRTGGPPSLRITGVDFPRPGDRPVEMMEETGRRLARYARAFGVPFEFSGVVAKEWEAVSASDLRVKKGEFVAVTCSHRAKNLPEESKAAVLGLIRRIGPEVFLHGVVEGAYGGALFVPRFREALHHFSALFDMVETSMPGGKPGRMQFEGMFRKEIMNVVACEGAERVEWPETHKQWQARHARAAFVQVGLGKELTAAVMRKVKSSYPRHFSVEEDNRWLLMSWKGRVIFALSCLEPASSKDLVTNKT